VFELLLPGLIVVFVLILAVSAIKIIRQSTVGMVERLGRFQTRAETGINFVMPFIDQIVDIIDMREQVIDFPPQPVITKDNVTMQIDTVVYFQVTDPVRYRYEISNPVSAIENLTATTLRNIVGEMELDETLVSRDVVNSKLRSVLDEATDRWGIRVNRVELKNINPPRDIQEAMEKQMRAERERREVILRAEGEKRSAILRAEGQREAVVLEAEAAKESAIRRAEGEAEAILAVQQARAEGLKKVFTAIKDTNPTKEVMAIRSMEALERLSEGQATKIVIPTEAAGILGALVSAKEILKGE